MYIINYHNVLDNNIDAFDLKLPRISQTDFEEQISFISRNFNVVSVQEIVDCIDKENNTSLKPKVAITFDDGCFGVLKYAIPVLKKYNVHATMYIVTDFANHSNSFKYYDNIEIAFRLTKNKNIDLSFLELGKPSIKHESQKIKYMKYVKRKLKVQEVEERKENTKTILNRLAVSEVEMKEYMMNKEKYVFLSWDEIKYIKSLGYDIGSHTKTHPTLSKIPLTSVFEELSKSFYEIKKQFKIEEISFAYPHGNIQHIGTEVPHIVKQIGYSFALTTIPEEINNSTDKFMINRMTFEEFIRKQNSSH